MELPHSQRLNVQMGMLEGETAGALAAFVRTLLPGSRVQLYGTRVVECEPTSQLFAVGNDLAMAIQDPRSFINRQMQLRVLPKGDGGCSFADPGSYSLYAVDREGMMPLEPSASLSYYARGVEGVRYRFRANPAGAASPTFSVTLKTLTGTVLRLDQVDSNLTVEEAKAMVHDLDGPPPDQQRLIFDGRQLEDGRPLGYYGMYDSDVVMHLVLRLRGGMLHETSGMEDMAKVDPSPVLVDVCVQLPMGGAVTLKQDVYGTVAELKAKLAAAFGSLGVGSQPPPAA